MAGLVQAHVGGSSLGSLATINLPDQPAVAGNLLTLTVAVRDTGDVNHNAPAGWTSFPGGALMTPAGTDTGQMFWKVAVGGETGVTFTPNGGGGWAGGVAEFDVGGLGVVDVTNELTGTGNPLSGAPVTPTTAVVIVGMLASRTGDFLRSAVATGDWTELHDKQTPGDKHPHLFACYQVVTEPSGAYTPSGTLSASGATYAAQTIAFTVQGPVPLPPAVHFE